MYGSPSIVPRAHPSVRTARKCISAVIHPDGASQEMKFFKIATAGAKGARRPAARTCRVPLVDVQIVRGAKRGGIIQMWSRSSCNGSLWSCWLSARHDQGVKTVAQSRSDGHRSARAERVSWWGPQRVSRHSVGVTRTVIPPEADSAGPPFGLRRSSRPRGLELHAIKRVLSGRSSGPRACAERTRLERRDQQRVHLG